MGAAHSSEAKTKGTPRRRGGQVRGVRPRSDAWSAGEWRLDQGLVGEVLCGETACMQCVEAPEVYPVQDKRADRDRWARKNFTPHAQHIFKDPHERFRPVEWHLREFPMHTDEDESPNAPRHQTPPRPLLTRAQFAAEGRLHEHAPPVCSPRAGGGLAEDLSRHSQTPSVPIRKSRNAAEIAAGSPITFSGGMVAQQMEAPNASVLPAPKPIAHSRAEIHPEPPEGELAPVVPMSFELEWLDRDVFAVQRSAHEHNSSSAESESASSTLDAATTKHRERRNRRQQNTPDPESLSASTIRTPIDLDPPFETTSSMSSLQSHAASRDIFADATIVIPTAEGTLVLPTTVPFLFTQTPRTPRETSQLQRSGQMNSASCLQGQQIDAAEDILGDKLAPTSQRNFVAGVPAHGGVPLATDSYVKHGQEETPADNVIGSREPQHVPVMSGGNFIRAQISPRGKGMQLKTEFDATRGSRVEAGLSRSTPALIPSIVVGGESARAAPEAAVGDAATSAGACALGGPEREYKADSLGIVDPALPSRRSTLVQQFPGQVPSSAMTRSQGSLRDLVLAKHGLGNVDGLDQYVYRRHDQASVELRTGGHHDSTPCPRDKRIQAPKVLETSALSPRFRC